MLIYFLGTLCGPAPKIPYSQCVSIALPNCSGSAPSYSKVVAVRPYVRPSVFGPMPKHFESWHCFFEILLASGFRLVQNSLQRGGGGKAERKQLVILAAIKSHPTQRK